MKSMKGAGGAARKTPKGVGGKAKKMPAQQVGRPPKRPPVEVPSANPVWGTKPYSRAKKGK